MSFESGVLKTLKKLSYKVELLKVYFRYTLNILHLKTDIIQ